MFPSLLFIFGIPSVSLMLLACGLFSDSGALFCVMHDWDLKYSPDTALTKQRVARIEFIRQYSQKLSHWIYPVIHMSTAQSSGVSIMAKMPFSTPSCLWWVESSVYELDRPLFLNPFDTSYFSFEEYWRLSIGSGFRTVSTSGWGGGIYGYYDYTTENGTHRNLERPRRSHTWKDKPYEYIRHLDVRHTISVGVELLMPKGRLVGNLYRKYMFSNDGKESDACLNGDIKLAFDDQYLTVSVGGYYNQQIFTYENTKLAERVKLPTLKNHIGIYGGVLELKYTGWWKIYSIKYTYDNLEQHCVSFGIEWQLFKPVSVYCASKQKLNLHPTERYLKAAQVNSKGVKFLKQRPVERKLYSGLEKERQVESIENFVKSLLK